MERWVDDKPIAIEIPGGSDPKTIWYVKQKTEEDLNVFEGSLERLRDAQKRLGLEITDSDHVRKEVDMDRETMAGSVVKVQNVHKSGDEVTDHDEIVVLLKSMAAARYRILRGLIVGSLDISVFERKA